MEQGSRTVTMRADEHGLWFGDELLVTREHYVTHSWAFRMGDEAPRLEIQISALAPPLPEAPMAALAEDAVVTVVRWSPPPVGPGYAF